MNKIIILFGAALMANGACALGKPALILKFGRGSAIGKSYFFPMPLTVSSAVDDYGWIQYESPTTYHENLLMYCASDDVTVCVMYDDTGLITAGLQIAIDKSKFSDEVLDWTIQGYTNWSVEVNGVKREFWCVTQYFVVFSVMDLEREDRFLSYNSTISGSTLLQDNILWVTGFNFRSNHLFTEIPTTTTEILDAGFTEHNCIAGMGTHYYYNMTVNTTCASDSLFPWTPLVDSGVLVGSVLNIVGQIAIDENYLDYFEHPSAAAVSAILKSAPDCLYSAASSPGLTTIHIYYYSDPHLITCDSS